MTTAKVNREHYNPLNPRHQIFTVVRASSNRNSFGLREYWLLGPDNRIWIACNSADHKVFDEVQIPVHIDGRPEWELARHESTAKDREKFLEFIRSVQPVEVAE